MTVYVSTEEITRALDAALKTGKENAIHMVELAAILDVKPPYVKKMVQRARKSGMQIVSDTNGYYKPANDEEARRFVETMRRQAISRFLSSKYMYRPQKADDGQLTLDMTETEEEIMKMSNDIMKRRVAAAEAEYNEYARRIEAKRRAR